MIIHFITYMYFRETFVVKKLHRQNINEKIQFAELELLLHMIPAHINQ